MRSEVGFVKRAIVMTFVMALLVAGCIPKREPPPLPPSPGPGDCASAKANLSTLPDGCGVDLATFESNCRDAERAEKNLGIRFPVHCLSNAADCATARACE